jgi:hypothetical protein
MRVPLSPLWGTIDETAGYIYTADSGGSANDWDAIIHILELANPYELISGEFIAEVATNAAEANASGTLNPLLKGLYNAFKELFNRIPLTCIT